MKAKKFVKVLSFLLSFVILFTSLNLDYLHIDASTYDPSQISIDLVKSGAIDIMLVSKNSNFDTAQMQQLETRIKEKLPSSYDVNFVGLETKTTSFNSNAITAQTILNSWYNYPGIGGHYAAGWYSDGEYLLTKENVNWTGYLNWTDEAKSTTDATYEFDVSYSGTHLDPEGWTFNTTKNDDGSYSFYALELDHDHGFIHLARIDKWVPSTSYQTHGGPIYHGVINGYDGRYNDYTARYGQVYTEGEGASGVMLGIAEASIPTSSETRIKIERKYPNIKVYVNNKLKINTDDSTLQKGAYGPYTVSQYNARFRNIKVTTETTVSKTMTEILRNATWRDEAKHLVINVDTLTDTSLTQSGELTSRLVADDVYMQFWGTDTNQSDFIAYGKGFGKDENGVDKYNFANQSTGFNSCVTATVDYINKILAAGNNSQYGIVNEVTDITVTPSGAKSNTADSTYPNGKWKIIHDDTKISDDKLENGMGISNKSGISMNNLTCSFDKPGNYDIYYMDRLIKTAYIHRRPVADFTIEWNKETKNVTISDTSYDLDTNLGSNKNGIRNVSWQWKKVSSDTWTDGYPSTWDTSDGIVVIKMTVTDYQGCSSSTAKYLGSKKPIAAFSYDLNPVSLYEDISVLNSSYDTTGYDITSCTWVLKDKDDVQKATSSVCKIGEKFIWGTPTSLNLPEGDYTVYLTVKNSAGVSSDTVSRTLHISKVVSHAIYEYNWDGGSHENYPEYVNVSYKAKYPTLVKPSKYYRVSFNPNTGTSVEANHLDAYSLFDGWYLQPTFDEKISSGNTVVTSNGNHTIYAKWIDSGSVTLPSAEKVYKVSFNKNDTALDSANLSTTSLVENWDFTGWYDNSDCTKKVGNAGDKLSNISSNQTLYAGWKDIPVSLPSITRQYKVTFNTNQGTPCNPISSDVEFKGWYDSASGGDLKGKAGDKYSVNKNEDLYAQWGTASVTLPSTSKDDAQFIGWFDTPQTNGKSKGASKAEFIGKAGDTIELEKSITLYAWFNTKPSLTKLGDKDFFEGQRNIGVSDLLSLVVGEDVEDTQGKHEQEVTLDSIKYSNGDKVDVSDDFTLDTSTKHVGEFEATYSITDLGIFIDDKVIESSPVTTVVTFKFNIKHNSAPVIKLSPSVFTYTTDIMLTKDTIEDFLLSHIDIDDEEDSKDNSPFWSKVDTIKALQDNTTILQVKNIVVNPAFAIENKSTASAIKKYNTLGQIYDLKSTNFNAFRAITSYEVVLDTHDQFGKYSSGKITPDAKSFGVSPCEDCNIQSEGDRTILVTQLDDSMRNSSYNHVRDVSMAYLDTVRTKSYWGDPSYGGKFLYSVLAKHGNKAKEPSIAYRGTYTQVNNDSNKIDVTVNDYTGDKTVEDNEDPILTYKVTNNFDDKQTVTLTGKDKISGIGGYYVGTVEPTEENIRNGSIVFSFNKFAEVRNEGTWYFAVKDNNDNVAYTSVNFYQVDLDLSNENIDSSNLSVTINKVIALENSEVELPVVETTGMRADNWLYNSKEIDKLVVTSSCTIVPNWQLLDFTITFNPNEGSCDTKSKSVTYLDSVGELPVPEREGYSFTGWHLGLEDDSPRVKEDSQYTWGTGITVYAHWKVNSYTLTFFMDDDDLQNNHPIEGSTRTLDFNEPYGELSTPTKKGYTFLGWFDGDNKVAPETKMKAKDVNVVAKWKVNSYTITLKGNKGIGSSDVKLSTSSVTRAFNDYMNLPEPSREGYNFWGWGLSDDWNSDTISSYRRYDFDKDITLYAHWRPKLYHITLDPMRGYEDTSISSSGSLTSLSKVGTFNKQCIAEKRKIDVYYDSVVTLPDNFFGPKSDDGKNYYVKRWESYEKDGYAKHTFSNELPTEVVNGEEIPVLYCSEYDEHGRYAYKAVTLQDKFIFRFAPASTYGLELRADYGCEYDSPVSFGGNTHDNLHHSIVETHYLNENECVGYCEHCGKRIKFEHKHKPGGTLKSHDECAMCGTILSSKHDMKLTNRDEVKGIETYSCSCGYSYVKYFIAYTKQGYGSTVDNNPHTINVDVKTEGCTIKYGLSEGKYNLDSPPSYTERGEHKIYFQIEKAGYPTVRDFASVILKNPNVTAANKVVEFNNIMRFDILGNGSIKTTYNNYGYYCNVRVDGFASDISSMSNDSTIDGIRIKRVSSTYNEYGRVMTTYTLTNTTSSTHVVDLAVHTDTQVASNDSAPTVGADYGYYTTADGYRFAYYVRNTEGVDNVDCVWVGRYNERIDHLYDYNSFATSCSDVDSGMAFSWMNRVIKPGESITLTWGMDIL